MDPRFVRVLISAAGMLALSFAGCGPSVQMIYEGNVRFEHCYRLDYDPAIAPSHRRACWQDWLARHTYGQTGDRLNYARKRLQLLSQGESPTLPLLVEASSTERPIGATAVPMPSNIHSAPPAKAPEPVAPASALPDSSAAPAKPPEGPCESACLSHWSECSPGCHRDTGRTEPKPTAKDEADAGVGGNRIEEETCPACDKVYRACMRKCFR
jgi:hypothetical protein